MTKEEIITSMLNDHQAELEAMSLPELMALYNAVLTTKAMSREDWQKAVEKNN